MPPVFTSGDSMKKRDSADVSAQTAIRPVPLGELMSGCMNARLIRHSCPCAGTKNSPWRITESSLRPVSRPPESVSCAGSRACRIDRMNGA